MNQCFFYDCDLRNNAGYCKVTACINPEYNSVTNTADGYISARYRPPVKKTNADRIRSMTGEELAEFLAQTGCRRADDDMYCLMQRRCKDCWLDWLKLGCEQ